MCRDAGIADAGTVALALMLTSGQPVSLKHDGPDDGPERK